MKAIESLQFIGSRKLGGAENFYIRLSHALRRAGSETLNLTRKGSELNDLLPDSRVELSLLSSADPLSRLRVSKVIERYQPKVVQTWMSKATRLVRLNAGSEIKHLARLGGFYKTAYYRHADAWVGNTKSICDYLINEGFPSKQVHYIGNFAPRDEIEPSAARSELRLMIGLPEDCRVLFSMGRLHTNKAFDTLISAFERLTEHPANKDLHLVIAGDGPLKSELLQLCKKESLRDRVHLLGWRNDASRLVAGADLFVCPSRHEPLGNVILEAWAQRVPVISTRTHGGLELIQNGENGVLVEIDDPIQLANEISRLLQSDEDRLKSLAESGYQTLESRFSERVIVDQYLDLYRSLT